MKILVTGSYCSGKSTICKQLFSTLHNATLVKEVPREVLHLFGKVDWSIPELRDYIFLKQLIEEEKRNTLNREYIIVDAGIVSILAHDNILLANKKDRNQLLKYFNHIKYDLVFYCDHTEIKIEDDGERYTSEILREEIGAQIIKVLKSLDYNKYIVLKGDKNQRLSTALKFVNLPSNE